MNPMLFPVNLKKKENDDGDPYWFAEQKQLNVCASEYEMEDCLDSIRDRIKNAFKEMGCTDDKFARLTLDLVAAKAEIEVDIKINRTLDEFTATRIETEASEEQEDEVPELDGGMAALPGFSEEFPENWTPQTGDIVAFKKPILMEECGVFTVDTDVPEDCEGLVFLTPIDKPDTAPFPESIGNIIPCKIDKENPDLELCKQFKMYQEMEFVNSGDVTEEETPKTCDGDCLECDCAEGDLPPCEKDPEWEPRPFEHVTIRDPESLEECGVFYVEDRFFQKKCLDGHVLISPIVTPAGHKNSNSIEVIRSRLKKGPESPSAKICRAKNCSDLTQRTDGRQPYCGMTGYTPSYNRCCPHDLEELCKQQSEYLGETIEIKLKTSFPEGGEA